MGEANHHRALTGVKVESRTLTLHELVLDVEEARQRFLNAVDEPSRRQRISAPG